MSDVATTSAHPGSISSRNIDTTTYRVLKPLPIDGIAHVGGTFRAWPYGEAIAWVLGPGPVCSNGDLRGWVEDGTIEVVRDAPGIAERRPVGAADARKASGGTRVAGKAKRAPAVTVGGGGGPWTLPGAEGAKG